MLSLNKKKTLADVNKKFEALTGEYDEVISKSKAEIEVIEAKQQELQRQLDFEKSEVAGSELVRDNLTKFLTQKL